MSWLSEIGKKLWHGLTIAKPFTQAVGMIVPGKDVFETTSEVIGDMEAIGEIVKEQGGTPFDKFSKALPLVVDTVRHYEEAKGNEVMPESESLFTQGCTEVLNGVVKIKKAVRPK